MGFSRQEYWSGLPFPPSGDLPDPGIEPASPISPGLAGGFFTTEPPSLLRKNKEETLDIFYFASWCYPKLCHWSAMETHYRKKSFCFRVLVSSGCELPQACMTSPAPSSCKAGTFFNNSCCIWWSATTSH